MQNPESNGIFSKANQQVEKMSKIIFYVVIKILVHCFMMPRFIISFFIYFTTKSVNDTLELPIPMW